MESLGEWLKRLDSSPYWKQAEQKTQELLNDPLIRGWRAKHPQIDDGIVRLHLNKLLQYATEYRQCSNCPGLERCPNDLQGHYTMLAVSESGGRVHIDDQKTPCRKWQAKQAQDAIRRRIRSFYVDELALSEGYSMEEILTKDMSRAKAAGRIADYIEQTKEQGLQRKGLYLVGKFGTGKTFLMCYMLYELAKIGCTGAIVYMPDLMEELKNMFQDPERMKETIDLLKETDLLVFDDIGAENLNPWLRDHVLGAILNYRMNRKPTFFTSNYELDALEKHFSFTSKDGDEQYRGQRLMDRIRHFVEVVVVNGANKRGET
jgi:primosomal protein DnaI